MKKNLRQKFELATITDPYRIWNRAKSDPELEKIGCEVEEEQEGGEETNDTEPVDVVCNESEILFQDECRNPMNGGFVIKPNIHPLLNTASTWYGVSQAPNGETSHGEDAAIDIAISHSWPKNYSCIRGVGVPVYATIDGYAYFDTHVNTSVYLVGYRGRDKNTNGEIQQYSILFAHLTSQSLTDYVANKRFINAYIQPGHPSYEVHAALDQVNFVCDQTIGDVNKDYYPSDTKNYDGNTRAIYYDDKGNCKGLMVQVDFKYHPAREGGFCRIEVQQGDLIGFVDDTGYSGGTHLHYEVWKDNNNNHSHVDLCNGYGIDCNQYFN